MNSIIENDVLEELITAYEQKLDRLRGRHLGSAKSIIVKNMENTLAKAKACLPCTLETI